MAFRFRRHIYRKYRLSLQMQTNRRNMSIAGLGILAAIIFVSPLLAPTFAWTSSLSTCVGSTYSTSCAKNPSYAIGTTVSDTAQLVLTNDGTPAGTVYFAVASGICSDHGTGTTTGVTGASQTATTGSGGSGTTTTTYTASLSTTGLSAGSYVWLVYYSGTGSGGYPRAPTSGYDCEPFTLFAGSIPTPQFPLGMAALLATALPAMLLIKRKFSISGLQAP